MKLKVLFGRYDEGVESYVEALEVMDDASYDINPEYLHDRMKERQESGSHALLRIVTLELTPQTSQEIIALLAREPTVSNVAADVKPEE